MPRIASLAALLLAAQLAAPWGTGAAVAASPIPTQTVVAPALLTPARPTPLGRTADRDRVPDPTGRWIVLLRPGASVDGARRRARGVGIAIDRTFRHAVHGYAARLTGAQVAALRADPTVDAVVPDAVISIATQSTPRGVRRVFGPLNPIAKIDGTDQRVNADVAIVDTGIDPNHRDLNVVGGHNCSTTNASAWQDGNGHGTHVAGIVGAIDNGSGVVGVAPGVRLWAVRILNSSGSGLVSWYVCGLDWITAQRDPSDSSRPLFEAVNMSVAKSGSDDHDCGQTNKDAMHRAICRLVGSGVTVVAAAGNNGFSAARLVPASYNEVITVSALADTDGRPGGLGGHACYSWGTYDRDDTFADFSNYGHDVDLIAPGKCIWSTVPGNGYAYLSGTSMATPHVTGAVALFKASRPLATPAQVRSALIGLGNRGWKTSTDPDGDHEPLLDVSHLVNLGDFALLATSPSKIVNGSGGGALDIPVEAARAEDYPDAIHLSLVADAQLDATLRDTTLSGFDDLRSVLEVRVPAGTPTGTYHVTVFGTTNDWTRSVRLAIRVDGDRPVARVPQLAARTGRRFDTSSFTARGSWAAASDATSSIAGYQAQWSVDGGAWGSSISVGASSRSVSRTFRVGHAYALRVRARDAAGNWGAWAAADPFRATVVQDGSPTIPTTGTWRRSTSSSWSGGSTRYAKASGASVRRSFTGRAVAIIAPRGPHRGAARVWMDGVRVATIDLKAANLHPRRVVFSRAWVNSGQHEVRLVVVGTDGRPRIDFDALVILR